MHEWHDSQPIYRQLRHRVAAMILDGVLKAGARTSLLKGERQKFLTEQWPRVAATIERLGLTPEELLKAGAKRRSPSKTANEEH